MSGAAPTGGTSVRDALQSAVTAIAAAGCETPRLDAEVLLAHVLGVGRERLHTDGELRVRGPAVRAFQDAVRRRAVEREPVAYIVERKGFRHLDLKVDRRALVPRPETELLVEVGLTLPSGASVLDVGTGSGAVALALKQERPDLQVHASDLSAAALALAGENAARLGLQVDFHQADLLLDDGLPAVEAVLANLPYVAEPELASLPPEIARHEPRSALAAGPEGLDAIGRLAAQLAARPEIELAALEVGEGQAPAVAELLARAGLANVRFECDLAGIERVVTGRRR